MGGKDKLFFEKIIQKIPELNEEQQEENENEDIELAMNEKKIE